MARQAKRFVLLQTGEEVPLTEAVYSIRIEVMPEDIKCALNYPKDDPHNCVLANAAKRQWGVTGVDFHRTVAYLQYPSYGRKAGTHFVRYILANNTLKAIAHYMKTGELVKGGYILSAPAPSKTLDNKCEYSYNYYHRRKLSKNKFITKRNINGPRGGKRFVVGSGKF
jgi:hypothetical protein